MNLEFFKLLDDSDKDSRKIACILVGIMDIAGYDSGE